MCTNQGTSIMPTHGLDQNMSVGWQRSTDPTNSICQTDSKSLPIFLLSNIQSFGSSRGTDKTTDIEIVLEQNCIDVACFTETWLNDNTKDHICFNNYISFHSVRNNVLRSSGGITLLVNSDIPACKLNIEVPEHLECLWISLRPKWLPRTVSNIVVAGVYYPGSNSDYAPSQEDLVLHLTASVHQLYKKYASPLSMILGDFNDMKVDEICDACDLKQIVKIPTRKEAILDLILTNNNNNLYKEPISLPSIGGSDHLSILYEPTLKPKTKTVKEKVLIRKFKKSAMMEFGSWLTKFDWSVLLSISDVNEKVAYFNNIIWIMIDKFFPLVKVVMTNNDKEWITPKIKGLVAERQRAHLKRNFKKRDNLARQIKHEAKEAKIKLGKSKSELFRNSNAKEWYRHISKIINNGKRSNIIFE